MKLIPHALIAGSALLASSLAANVIVYSENFDSVTGLKDFQFQLGGNTVAASTKYIGLGQWGSATNSGINEAAAGAGTGASTGNDLSSIGVARPQDVRGTNTRAVVTILPASLFTPGTEYQVSFDVIGDVGSGTGFAARYFIDFVRGYDLGATNGSAATDAAIILDNTPAAFGDIAVGVGITPFTAKNGATVTNVAEGFITGIELAATTRNAFNFTYAGANGADVALALTTYNSMYAIDNLTIVAVPEPSTALLALGALGMFAAFRFRRRA